MPEFSQKQKYKNSFLGRHKKKIIAGLVILLLLILAGITNDHRRLQQEKYRTKYSPQQIQENLPQLITEFDKAVKDEDQEKIKQILNYLESISAELTPEAKTEIKKFLTEQLDNPELPARHKQQINNLLAKIE